MSAKGEKYKSAKAKMRHEMSEGMKERKMEYGSKKASSKKSASKKAMPKKKGMK